jgi:hypothetical protein
MRWFKKKEYDVKPIIITKPNDKEILFVVVKDASPDIIKEFGERLNIEMKSKKASTIVTNMELEFYKIEKTKRGKIK